jgi:hypothetical protein
VFAVPWNIFSPVTLCSSSSLLYIAVALPPRLFLTINMGSISEPTAADVTILGFTVTDIRFPTSLDGVGSDAMHVGTNGSHPFVQLHTNHKGLVGEGIVRLPSLPIKLDSRC